VFFSRSSRYWYREYRRSVRRRRLVFLLMAALVIFASAAAHQAHPHQDHRKHPAPARTTPRATPTTHAAAPRPRRSRNAAARPELTWTDFHGIELPASSQDGPRHTRNGLVWGFTDTRTGALMAAVNITVRTAAQRGPAIYRPTICHEVTGPDAALLLSNDTSDYAALRAADHVRPGQPAGRGYATEAAYRFVSWAPKSATVDIVTEGPGSGSGTVLAVTQIQVTWLHGDWHVVAPADGNWASSATTASSLSGYTTFPSER
jgi:hypothetical protein